MTDDLKTLMERTSDVDFAPVDLDAVMRAGDRSVRRRHSVVAGVAAVAIALGATTAGLLLQSGDGGPRGLDDPARGQGSVTTNQTTWVTGRTLHSATGTVRLDQRPAAYRRTAAGFVFVSADGDVWALVDGRQRTLGRGADPDGGLVSDEGGSWVGWVDRSGDRPAFAAADLAADPATTEVVRDDRFTDGPGTEPVDGALLFAIDGTTAYWLDSRGTVAHDLRTGAERVLQGIDPFRSVGDVTGGRVLGLVEDDRQGDVGSVVLDTDLTVVRGVVKGRYLGVISPDGRRVTSMDTGSWFDVDTGARRAFPVALDDDRARFAPYEWLDDGTVSLVRRPNDDDDRGVALWTCAVPAGTCRQVADGLPDSTLISQAYAR